ncbi:hypothetical protein E2C01_080718 [Portunus trituberculatus]|uniref:Uncharacterized protein n=1 Tax=Portunus trituberculatus TaxID=210409 RepID=A0A5B7IU49_PORTR|nr:hypothetical protein [Portunus trituberculatus]
MVSLRAVSNGGTPGKGKGGGRDSLTAGAWPGVSQLPIVSTRKGSGSRLSSYLGDCHKNLLRPAIAGIKITALWSVEKEEQEENGDGGGGGGGGGGGKEGTEVKVTDRKTGLQNKVVRGSL